MSSLPEMFCKKGALKNFCKIHRKTTVTEFFLIKVADLFSCEFCEIFKNAFFSRTPFVAPSVLRNSQRFNTVNVTID